LDEARDLLGPALDYAKRGVREWAIQNAELWTREYRIDGLRLDAVHAVADNSDPHVLKELRDRVDGIVISEMNHEDLRPLDEWGHDAMWLDNLHHELHILLTGERRALYETFGSIDGLVRELQRAGGLVVRAQNHDQIGNRALATGCRRTSTASRSRACSSRWERRSCSWARSTTSAIRSVLHRHADRAVADATREGRKREVLRSTGTPDAARSAGRPDLRALDARGHPDPIFRGCSPCSASARSTSPPTATA
jgi:hypothetical protein